MGNKWVWIAFGLLCVATYYGVGFFVSGSNGDEEFQKMLASMQQVKSFRGTYVSNAASGSQSSRLWEVDCNRGVVHKQSRDAQAGAIGANSAPDTKEDMKDDELLVGTDQLYTRASDGSWEKHEYKAAVYSGTWYCDNIAQGTVRDLLPDVRRMLRSAMIGKADKKTVNGVRCQEWEFHMKSSTSGEQGTVCVGLEDHLPYQMTMEGGQFTYSDYNRPIQFDAPEGVLQATSSTSRTN